MDASHCIEMTGYRGQASQTKNHVIASQAGKECQFVIDYLTSIKYEAESFLFWSGHDQVIWGKRVYFKNRAEKLIVYLVRFFREHIKGRKRKTFMDIDRAVRVRNTAFALLKSIDAGSCLTFSTLNQIPLQNARGILTDKGNASGRFREDCSRLFVKYPESFPASVLHDGLTVNDLVHIHRQSCDFSLNAWVSEGAEKICIDLDETLFSARLANQAEVLDDMWIKATVDQDELSARIARKWKRRISDAKHNNANHANKSNKEIKAELVADESDPFNQKLQRYAFNCTNNLVVREHIERFRFLKRLLREKNMTASIYTHGLYAREFILERCHAHGIELDFVYYKRHCQVIKNKVDYLCHLHKSSKDRKKVIIFDDDVHHIHSAMNKGFSWIQVKKYKW